MDPTCAKEISKRDQYSIIEDPKTHQLYQLASSSTKTLEAIYKVFELKKQDLQK